MSTRMLRTASVLAVAVAFLLLPGSPETGKAHVYPHFIEPDIIRVPFSGTNIWAGGGEANNTAYKHNTSSIGGDWQVDVYKLPGNPGYFKVLYSAITTGKVVFNGSACGTPGVWAGRQYSVQIQNSSWGSRGTVYYLHVDDINPNSGASYVVALNTTISHNHMLGWTYQFSNTNCYAVGSPQGVHWHIEMYQSTHYSCFLPHAYQAPLSSSTWMGKIGSNALTGGVPTSTNWRTACGSYTYAQHTQSSTPKCLQPQGGGTANFTYVVQVTCSGHRSQHMAYEPMGGGYSRIRFLHSDKCLDTNWTTYNGAPMMIYDCHDGYNQQWSGVWGVSSQQDPAPYYHQNRANGKYIAILASSQSDNAQLVQWDLYIDPNFRFLNPP
jgi:hypothetical protein